MIKNISKSLDKLFSPASVSVVGAAREEHKIGHIVVRNLIDGGYPGHIFPINPSADEICGLKCYHLYVDTPQVPDLAIVALPASLVLTAVADIAARGTKSLIIFSAGFKESGPVGIRLEKQLQQLAEQYRLTIVGPNCLGLINGRARLNATFGTVPLTALGNLRFISQSGAIATSIFDWAEYSKVGLDEFITLGNKAVVTENEVLRYWLAKGTLTRAEQRTQRRRGLSSYRPIGMYLESITGGEEFRALCRKMSLHNPLFIVKPGASIAAQHAMMSHTGALAGNNAVLEEALNETGVIRCHGAEDLFDLAQACAWEDAPRGPCLAVVSNAGGPAVMSTDSIEKEGLTLAPLSIATQKFLLHHLPAAVATKDPVDVLGDALADRYAVAIEKTLQEKTVDALLVILTPQLMTEVRATAETIARLAKLHHKPVFCSFMGASAIVVGEKILRYYKIPTFRYPERAIWALGRMWWWQNWRNEQRRANGVLGRGLVSKLLPRVRQGVPNGGQQMPLVSNNEFFRKALNPLEANFVLKKYGLSVPATMGCSSLSAAHQFLKKHKSMVIKVASSLVLHKSDSGGVITGINSPIRLDQAWSKLARHIVMLKKAGDANATIQLQQQIIGGIEIIVGCKRDDCFGPVIMLGAGGTMVELFKERTLRLLPLTTTAVQSFVKSSSVYPLLSGYRGRRPYAIYQLCNLIFKLGEYMMISKQVAEIEINPVILTTTKAWAVDGKIIAS